MTTTLKHQSNNFLFHCKIERNLSPKTLKAYETDLKQFLQFLLENNHNIIINEISKNQIREYLATISNLKPKSIKRKIAYFIVGFLNNSMVLEMPLFLLIYFMIKLFLSLSNSNFVNSGF